MTNAEFREQLERRTTQLAVNVFKYIRALPYDVSTRVICFQLCKSASSIGANYYEASRAESKEDFVHKVAVAPKEANETVYWFRVLSGLFANNPDISRLAADSEEIRNVLQSIVHSMRKNPTHNS